MLRDQCISVTDLRTKTKQCLDGVMREPKYIFINNRPIAVLMGLRAYESGFTQPRLFELSDDAVDARTKKRAATARRMKKASLMDIR